MKGIWHKMVKMTTLDLSLPLGSQLGAEGY